MNDVNQNKPATICGALTDIRTVPTRTGTAFVVCKVGGHKCKLFGELANLVLANQDQYEGQQMEARGHWDERRGSEFVIDGFVKQPARSTLKPVSDSRPEKPAVDVTERYVVITIPRDATHEQVRRIADVANETVRGMKLELGPGVFGLPAAQIETIHPKDQVQVGDIEF